MARRFLWSRSWRDSRLVEPPRPFGSASPCPALPRPGWPRPGGWQRLRFLRGPYSCGRPSLRARTGASRPDLNAAMRGASGASRVPPHVTLWLSPRGILVAAQIALSAALLCGAALLLQRLARLRRVDPGFHASNLLTKSPCRPPSTRFLLRARNSSASWCGKQNPFPAYAEPRSCSLCP
jgi:hypothetical protein